MITDAQLACLESAALDAIGRPELRCQVAMADLYKLAGVLPVDLAVPTGDRNWAMTEGRSLITPWVEQCGYFEEVSTLAIPGDLLGFRLGHTLHHVSIQLGGGRMVHVFGDHGVQIAPFIPDQWQRRLEKIWRIKA